MILWLSVIFYEILNIIKENFENNLQVMNLIEFHVVYKNFKKVSGDSLTSSKIVLTLIEDQSHFMYDV